MKRTVRKAFTLVEILIVVVILGILAAIVVPQFTNATQDAQAGNIKAQLDTLNNQLELYRARNNGNLPADFVAGGATAWDTLIAEGYLKAAPRNPSVSGANAINVVMGAGAAANGWHYYDASVPADGVNDTLGACYFDEATGSVTPSTP